MSRCKLLLITLLLFSTVGHAEEDVQQRLRDADQFRLAEAASKVNIEVIQFSEQREDKRHRYHVYTRPQRQSLVVFKTASEQGQKMLMLEDNYWLLMPNSRRPIRITPLQKLLGEAAIGDVSSMTWSNDYTAELGELSQWQGHSARQLHLKAKTSGASYQRIELWLDEQSNFPLKADLYLVSGRLAKQAQFEPGTRDGALSVASMTLSDAIQTSKATQVRYLSIDAHQLPDKYYNPAYLSRQSVEHL